MAGKGSRLRKRMSRKAQRLQMLADTPRVLIGTPMQDTCLATYTKSVVHCVANSIAEGLVVGYQHAQYSMLPLSRNLLAEAAIEAGWTHLLFIDSDMQFEPDMALRLVRHRQPIVAANCMARRHPHFVTARREDGSEIYTSAESSGIEKVARVGTGVMLIHLDVFRAIPKPWFEYVWLPEKGIFRGEDFVFCDKAREAGFDIYIDHDVSKTVGHVGQFAYSAIQRPSWLEVERDRNAQEATRNEGEAA